jgi:hypothetical protein
MMVTCPPNVRAGDHIMVMVPRQTAPPQGANSRAGQIYMATVPQGVQPGKQFNVLVNGKPVTITCPPGVSPGMQIRIRLPEAPAKDAAAGNGTLHQTFEVTVPDSVKPGQPFALIANGQR